MRASRGRMRQEVEVERTDLYGKGGCGQASERGCSSRPVYTLHTWARASALNRSFGCRDRRSAALVRRQRACRMPDASLCAKHSRVAYVRAVVKARSRQLTITQRNAPF